MATNAWVGNYYVGGDGSMLIDTLTPDGYWLGEDGLASESRRIYGTCVFKPESHRREGDKIIMTGMSIPADMPCIPNIWLVMKQEVWKGQYIGL